ncbi:hypothetical protein F4781DRAFT_441357 [Annulohypoxylon bovei var. microspora]|nr:hypothetical protein F4781DRAFT_441357 [Annulohypoxylon bovei var. microspora]
MTKAHDIRHSRYHQVLPCDGDVEMQHGETQSLTGRPRSLDSLYQNLSSSSPANLVVGDHPLEGFLTNTTDSVSTTTQVNSSELTDRDTTTSQAENIAYGTWLSKWTFVLQPNTLISILVTAAQSSMMLVVAEVIGQLKWLHMSLQKRTPTLTDVDAFESASRGPLGSLLLFYRWKPRTVILFPLVYMALLITIVALAMGPLEPQDNVNATIAISNHYHNNTETGLQFFSDESGDTEADMQGAYYSGIYGLDASFIDFTCPSSNCSWGRFTALSLCSTCRDVSASTEATRNLSTAVHQLQTPGGWNLSFDDWDTVVSESRSSIYSSLNLLDTLSANLMSFAVVQRAHNDPERCCIVTECSTAWCAKQYSNITVTNGVLQNEHSVLELPLWPVKGQDFGGLARGQTTFSNWIFMLTLDSNGGNVSSALPPFDHSGFNVGIYDHMAITNFFLGKFNISSESKTVPFSSGENVTSTLANVTARMTKKIPRSGSETIAPGVIWQQQSIIRIQFAWLALPLSLVLCSAILFIMTVLVTRRFCVPVWKSSPLPFLYHGIQEWDDDEKRDLVDGRLEKLHLMEGRASLTRVRMFRSPQGGSWLAK